MMHLPPISFIEPPEIDPVPELIATENYGLCQVQHGQIFPMIPKDVYGSE